MARSAQSDIAYDLRQRHVAAGPARPERRSVRAVMASRCARTGTGDGSNSLRLGLPARLFDTGSQRSAPEVAVLAGRVFDRGADAVRVAAGLEGGAAEAAGEEVGVDGVGVAED